jgi:hypothetical protein
MKAREELMQMAYATSPIKLNTGQMKRQMDKMQEKTTGHFVQFSQNDLLRNYKGVKVMHK